MDNNIDRLKELAGIQTERYSDDQLFGFTKQQIDDIRSLEAEIAGTTDHDELARLEPKLDGGDALARAHGGVGVTGFGHYLLPVLQVRQ